MNLQKTSTNKWIYYVLGVIICLGLVFLANLKTVNAATSKDGMYEYNEILDDLYKPVAARIYRYLGTDTKISIPKKIDGLKVTSVSLANNTVIKEVIIPSGVESLPQRAFENCTSLEKITIPKSVDRPYGIGDSVFENCTSLKSIKLPPIDTIPTKAFKGCTSLKKVVFQPHKDKSPKTYMGSFVFDGCTALEEVKLPSDLHSIGDGTFRGCTSLKSINIPDSVYLIGYDAFKDCPLEELNLPNNDMFKLDKYRNFLGLDYRVEYEKLPTITVPEKVKNIDTRFFEDRDINLVFKGYTSYIQYDSHKEPTFSITAPKYSDAYYFAKEHNLNYTELKTKNKFKTKWSKAYINIIEKPYEFLPKNIKNYTTPDYGFRYSIMDVYGDKTPELILYSRESLDNQDRDKNYFIISFKSNKPYILAKGKRDVKSEWFYKSDRGKLCCILFTTGKKYYEFSIKNKKVKVNMKKQVIVPPFDYKNHPINEDIVDTRGSAVVQLVDYIAKM